MFKKLTQLITPPPFQRTPTPQRAPACLAEPSLAAMLKPLLKKLLSAPSVQDPTATQSLSEIKEIARQKGLYITAFEIRVVLDMMPNADTEDGRYRKQRGYVLAGDFFLAEIRRQVGALRTGSESIGPKIFRGYCNEMIAALLEGENARRAIEVPVLLLDDLLASAVDDFERCAVYLEMTSQLLESALELSKQHFERQGRQSAPSSNPETREAAPTSVSKKLFTTLDKEAISYLEDIRRRVEIICEGFLHYRANLTPKDHQSADIFKNGANRPEYLLQLLTVANADFYLPFAATLRERVGNLIEEAQPENAKECFQSAAADSEAQGDRENRLLFFKLSRKRYEKAHDLFLRAGDGEKAGRVKSKISNH